MQDRLPGKRVDFDDATVAQELGEIAADCSLFWRVRRAEVDQQDTDLAAFFFFMAATWDM